MISRHRIMSKRNLVTIKRRLIIRKEKMVGISTDKSEARDLQINHPTQKDEPQDVSMELCDDTMAIDDPLQGDANLKQDHDTIFQKMDINIVLVGHAGDGKSATGNSILGGKFFKSMPSASSVTLTCEKKSKQLSNGRTINVIDTQGFGDTFTQTASLIQELTKCFDQAKNEIHAILLVVSVRSRFSKGEAAAIRNLKTILGANVVNYVIVVFTGGDDIENKNKITLEDYLCHDCPHPLKPSTSPPSSKTHDTIHHQHSINTTDIALIHTSNTALILPVTIHHHHRNCYLPYLEIATRNLPYLGIGGTFCQDQDHHRNRSFRFEARRFIFSGRICSLNDYFLLMIQVFTSKLSPRIRSPYNHRFTINTPTNNIIDYTQQDSIFVSIQGVVVSCTR